MSAHTQQMPPLMPTHPAPPPPTPSGTVAASPWQQPAAAATLRLDRASSSRRNSGRISADEADDHYTDVDSLYGDPNAPSSNQHQHQHRPHPPPSSSSSLYPVLAHPSAPAPSLTIAASSSPAAAPPPPPLSPSRIVPGRQASFSSLASSSAASSASPRQSIESPSSPTFGAARPFSVSSSIWAGKGALHPSTAANRKRTAPVPPPMPPLPPAMVPAGSQQSAAAAAGNINRPASSTAGSSNPASPLFPHQNAPARSPSLLPANSPHSIPSPLSEDYSSAPRQSFESGSMYSYMDDDTRAGHGASPRSTMDWRSADARGFLPNGTALPPIPPLPPSIAAAAASAAAASPLPDPTDSRKQSIPTINKPSPVGFAEASAQRPSNRSGLRPPPMNTSRRHVLSYEEAEAQEEQELSALQREEDLVGGPAANKRLSTMGPKLKKNSPAPWELGGDDGDEPHSAGSAAGGSSGAAAGSSFNPFSKRPSTDGRDSADVRRPPLPAKDSFGSGGGGGASSFFSRPSRDLGSRQPQHTQEPFPPSLAVGLESENTDSGGMRSSLGESSNASGTRSRTKSISSAAAAGVLKGLGLGSSTSAGPMQSSINGAISFQHNPPVSAPSSMGKKSKLAKALRLGNSSHHHHHHHHTGPTPPSSYSALDGRGPISSSTPMYAQKSSESRLSQEEAGAISGSSGPASLSNMNGPASRSSAGGDSSHHHPSALQVQQQQAQSSLQQSSSYSAGQNSSDAAAAAAVSGGDAARSSVSAPQSPLSYSPHSAASPSLPPLMSHSHSSVLRQSDDLMMSPTSATGGQRSSSSTTAHTSLSTGAGVNGSGTNGPGLKALLLQPRPPASSRRQGTGDGFGGAGGPLGPFPAAPSTPTMGSVTDGSEEDWRKPLVLSPRTTSLGMSPGGGGGPGTGHAPLAAANNRSRMPTSPTATRLGSLSGSNNNNNNHYMPTSESIQTITETTQNLGMGSGRRGASDVQSAAVVAAAGVGLDRYASPPPSGAAITGPTALGLTPSTSGIDPNAAHGTAEELGGGDGGLPANFPRPGQAEGVPYKLISLEQARANQAREREERNARSAKAKGAGASVGISASGSHSGASGGGGGGGVGVGMAIGSMGRSQSIPGGSHFPSSSSQGHGSNGGIRPTNEEEIVADHVHGPSSGHSGGGFGVKALKNKKSGGFLRMFNKDRAGSDPHAPPVPHFGPGGGGGNVNQMNTSGEEGRFAGTGVGEDASSRGSYGKGSISHPPTPKFTVSRDTSALRGSDSTSGGNSGGGGLAPLGGGQGGGAGLSAPALKLRPMSSMMAGFADLLDPSLTDDPLPAVSNPDTSSNTTLAVASGAPVSSAAVLAPASPSGATKSPPLLSPVEATTHSNSRSTSMTSFTSAGATSDDAKIAGRSAVGGGGGVAAAATLATSTNNSPAMEAGSSRLGANSRSTSISAATASDGTTKTTLRVDPTMAISGGEGGMSPGSVGGSSEPAVDSAADSAVIPPCSMCGCTCGEQRRLQALNAAAVLEGVSVLDRGRAIKPGMNQSSKFGSYALR